MPYQVKQLNHILLKHTVTCAPTYTTLVRDWLPYWTAGVPNQLLNVSPIKSFPSYLSRTVLKIRWQIKPLNAKLNPIFHLMASLGAHPIHHLSRIRVSLQCMATNSPQLTPAILRNNYTKNDRLQHKIWQVSYFCKSKFVLCHCFIVSVYIVSKLSY